jgi:hypothetical protein
MEGGLRVCYAGVSLVVLSNDHSSLPLGFGFFLGAILRCIVHMQGHIRPNRRVFCFCFCVLWLKQNGGVNGDAHASWK